MTAADRLVIAQCRERLANERLLLRMIRARVSARIAKAEKGAVKRCRAADAALARAKVVYDRAALKQANAAAALRAECDDLNRAQAIAVERARNVRQAKLDLAAARQRAAR